MTLVILNVSKKPYAFKMRVRLQILQTIGCSGWNLVFVTELQPERGGMSGYDLTRQLVKLRNVFCSCADFGKPFIRGILRMTALAKKSLSVFVGVGHHADIAILCLIGLTPLCQYTGVADFI